jgi:hypothetical protein
MSRFTLSDTVGVNGLVSRAALARLAGVSRAAITKACRGPLLAAVASDLVDLNHPAVVAYLARRRSSLAQPTPPTATPELDLEALADRVAAILAMRWLAPTSQHPKKTEQ